MSILNHGICSLTDYEIARSLRFNSADSAYLSRTPTVVGDRKTWTFSTWVKISDVNATHRLFVAGVDTNNRTACNISSGSLTIAVVANGTDYSYPTTRVLRDPAAWYHLVFIQDTTQATTRFKIYVNNELCTTSSDTLTAFATQNYEGHVNNTIGHWIGQTGFGAYSNYYKAETQLVVGQALDPSYFGYTDPNTHQWRPKKYTGSYGNNGFYLDFSDNTSTTTLGYDRSGNNNHWTLNNFSVVAGVDNDSLTDTPTNNFCTLNPLNQLGINGGAGTVSNGSLTISQGTANYYSFIPSSLAIPTTGKWQAEFTPIALATNDAYWDSMYGISAVNTSGSFPSTHAYYLNDSGISGTLQKNGTTVQSVSPAGVGQVVGVVFDADNNSVQFYLRGSALGSAITGLMAGEYQFFCSARASSPAATTTIQANFGQRPFSYPVDGAKSLCTKNLPTPTGAAAKPWEHFNINLATGANIKSVCEDDFTYFMEWIKDRGNSNNHQLIDTVRGTSAVLQSNTTNAETTYSAPSGSSVGWVFNAGSSAVTNNSGSITSQVSANTAAGFSIVTATLAGANATIGHGLGIAPKIVVGFNRGGGTHPVYHASLTSAAYVLYLEQTAAQAPSATTWNSTAPTSSVFSTGTGLTGNWVFYCFAEIPGYSKFGSYTGNGSADGPFVYCGFRPRWILRKGINITGVNWGIIDTSRNSYNIANSCVCANTADAEATFGDIDITSNGFKARSSSFNTSGETYIYLAIASNPFKYSNAR